LAAGRSGCIASVREDTRASPTAVRRVRDFAEVKGGGLIEARRIGGADMLEVDPQGFEMRTEIAAHGIEKSRRPVGVDSLAARERGREAPSRSQIGRF